MTFSSTLPNNELATNIENLGNLYLLQNIINNVSTNLSLLSEGAQGKIITAINPNLYALACQYYGDATQWTTIANANGISDPIFSGGAIINVKITDGGSGYSANPIILFLGDEINAAVVSTRVVDGVLTEINVQNGGLYGVLPKVFIEDIDGIGAEAIAICAATLVIPQTSTASGGLLNTAQ